MRRAAWAGLALVSFIAGALWLVIDNGAKPLVCSQVSPSVKYARLCSTVELKRIRSAHVWVANSFPGTFSADAAAGLASFVEDTGRRARTEFFNRMKDGDIEGGCDAMLKHVNRRGEVDPARVERRTKERAMCLSKE